MELSYELAQRVIARLEGKEGSPSLGRLCFCGANQWTITKHIFEMREYSGGGFAIGGAVVPYVTLQCAVCGEIKCFNAILLGVIDAKTGNLIEANNPSAPAMPVPHTQESPK